MRCSRSLATLKVDRPLPWTCRRCFSAGKRLQEEPTQPTATEPAEEAEIKKPESLSTLTPETRLPDGAVIFSAIQPTGVPHLGNYLGALQRWVQLQDATQPSTRLYYAVADLHALTTPSVRRTGAVLRQRRHETLAAMMAVGLDPDRCVLFYQSAVPAHSELMWLMSCTASVGYLSRMTQWKNKLQLRMDAGFSDERARANLKLGLFSYPVLQAADVLIHRATHVPVGEDQAQHLEFTRECATNFNATHGTSLVAPQTLLSPARRVMSLQKPALKMSKSHVDQRSRIDLTDTAHAIQQKILGSRTDGNNTVTYDPLLRPGVANLLEIFALTGGLADLGIESVTTSDSIPDQARAIAAALQGQNLRVLKEYTAAAVIQQFSGIRGRFLEILDRDRGAYLDRIAAHGATKAAANAEETMEQVRLAVGL